jgi:hypothetical protein
MGRNFVKNAPIVDFRNSCVSERFDEMIAVAPLAIERGCDREYAFSD